MAVMLHCFLFLSTFCGGCFYCAHSYPATYLRWQDGITWGTHALSLGLIFGIGVIVGRYGFVKEVSSVIAHWLIVCAPIVISLYVATLLYHQFLCTLAEDRLGYSETGIGAQS
jgi:hypothetical protein